MKITKETAKVASKTTSMILFVNSFPNNGEIVSNLTIFNFVGREPVIKTVCNLFIFFTESCIASCSVIPTPGPEIEILVASCPFRSEDICNVSTSVPSKYNSKGLLRYSEPDSVIFTSKSFVISACFFAASELKDIVNSQLQEYPF